MIDTSAKQKTPLHFRLTCDDWVNSFHQLDRSEIGVFYYIKTLDPFGDRVIEFNSNNVAEVLKLHRTSVSRALKSLAQKGFISLDIITAKVSIKVSQKVVCMDAQDERPCTEVSVDAQDERPCTEVSVDAQDERPCTEVSVDAQEHNNDRARAQTNSNLIKTNSDLIPPNPPQGEIAAPEAGEDLNLEESLPQQSQPSPNTLTVASPNIPEIGQITQAFENDSRKTKTSNQADEEFFEPLRIFYNQNKPSTWAECQTLNKARLRALRDLYKELGDRTVEALSDALMYITQDEWWREKCSSRSIDTLLRRGKVTQLRDCYLVNKKAAVVPVRNEETGYVSTGATAEAVAAIENDEMFKRLFINNSLISHD